MPPDPALLGLLGCYVKGDRAARTALLYWLEKRGDPRAAVVRREQIDWETAAREAAEEGTQYGGTDSILARYRYLIDCARTDSVSTPSNVLRAVERARRRWLQQLFPEFCQPGG
jgi:hypothetical protein